MKKHLTGLFVLLIGACFLPVNIGRRHYFQSQSVHASSTIPNPTDKANIPSFLMVGKTYQFSFAVHSEYTSYVTRVGKVEKIDPDSGWVYIAHFVTVGKGKLSKDVFQGNSWINMNLVFECFERSITN